MWWLLQKIGAECEECSVGDPPAVRTAMLDQKLIQKFAKGNKHKERFFSSLLTTAQKRGLVQVHSHCKHCHTSMIHLTSEGEEFTDFFELTEYLLSNYKLSWGGVIKLATLFTAVITGSFLTIRYLVLLIDSLLG